MLGTKQLNKYLQETLNPSKNNEQEKQYGDIVFRQGDRVMQIKNNYDIYWEKGSRKDDGLEFETGSGIFNGEIGRITFIDKEQKLIEVLFDDMKKAWYSFSELDELEHAYAITVHKAQGSEFDVGIIAVSQSSKML